MRYLTFQEPEAATYPVCFLVQHLQRIELQNAYIIPHGLKPEELLAIDLFQKPGVKKIPEADMVGYIENELQPVLDKMQVE